MGNDMASLIGGTIWSSSSNTVLPEWMGEITKLKEAHLVIAKDQENRICELESAVTILLEYVEKQKEERKIAEEWKKAEEYAQAAQNQNAQYCSFVRTLRS